MDKKFKIGAMAIIAVAIVLGITIGTTGVGIVNAGATLKESNRVVIQVDTVNGEHLTYVVHPNTMTIGGENATITALFTGTMPGSGILKYISVGSNVAMTTDNSLTILSSELTGGLARATGTITAPAGPYLNTYSVSNKFTATATTTENCAGLHWISTPASDNNLWAYAFFPATTTNLNDNITITWTVTFTPS